MAFNTGAENRSDPPNRSERFPAAAAGAAGAGLEAAEGGGTLLGAAAPPRSARKSKEFVACRGEAASSRFRLDFSCDGGWEAANPDMSDSCLDDPASDNPRRSTVEEGDGEEEVLLSGVVLVVVAVTDLSCSLLRSGLLTKNLLFPLSSPAEAAVCGTRLITIS